MGDIITNNRIKVGDNVHKQQGGGLVGALDYWDVVNNKVQEDRGLRSCGLGGWSRVLVW